MPRKLNWRLSKILIDKRYITWLETSQWIDYNIIQNGVVWDTHDFNIENKGCVLCDSKNDTFNTACFENSMKISYCKKNGVYFESWLYFWHTQFQCFTRQKNHSGFNCLIISCMLHFFQLLVIFIYFYNFHYLRYN